MKSVDLIPVEPAAALQPDRIEPEFSNLVLALYVNVWWLFPVSGIEEESVRFNLKYSWHPPLFDPRVPTRFIRDNSVLFGVESQPLKKRLEFLSRHTNPQIRWTKRDALALPNIDQWPL